ncbi:hypothetical protein [Flavobacterium sp.]|uniref:hypothetical protein n=1 Tax=Flavobacterium sp. TaxID=239 RepID=UPI0024894F89|nr:hypothetical protein [Flavobacterium sp.]MDI1317428.1 hypothetical protein [Flavobacterium sp.]
MKKYFLLIILISTFSFAQKDYSKSSKEELINTINSKDKELKSLKEKLESEKTAKEKLETNQTKSTNAEIAQLKKSIKETNAVFLREIFDNKYVSKPYLMETDLAIDDISTRIENSNILIRSILLDDTNKEVFEICNKALDFNKNYLKLFQIRNDVIFEKYDSVKVNEAIKEIQMLPALDENSKLDSTKKRMSSVLKNYLENTCLLKKTLDAYKKADQSAILKQKYTALEKDEHYKDYPYLVQTIKKIKNSVVGYTDDDLQPCDEVKEKVTKNNEDDKSSKENSPIKTKELENKK